MTLSNEELQQIAADGFIKHGDAKVMAAELQERRERDKQEPVGYTYNRGINCEIVAADLNSDCPCGIDLYAAPPTPVVTEELLTAMEEVLRISDRQHDAWDRAKAAITTLRSAPQSFGNSEQLNSPAVPDGFIAAVNRLLDNDGSRGCYSAIQCYEAHAEIEKLLAAAPKQESE